LIFKIRLLTDFTNDFATKCLPIMSLHYLVKYKYSKTYKWIEWYIFEVFK